jgi:hypothetical protein
VLIAEELVLLCIDKRTGTFDLAGSRAELDTLVAAALLVDLTEQHRLRYSAGHVATVTNLPITHPQLSYAARILGKAEHPLLLAAAIDLLVTRLNPISKNLMDRLHRRDVLHRNRASWWPWSEASYPLRSLQARNEAADQLNKGAVSKQTTLRGLALLVLTDAAGQLTNNLDGNAREIATLKLLELSSGADGENPSEEFLAELHRVLTT